MKRSAINKANQLYMAYFQRLCTITIYGHDNYKIMAKEFAMMAATNAKQAVAQFGGVGFQDNLTITNYWDEVILELGKI